MKKKKHWGWNSVVVNMQKMRYIQIFNLHVLKQQGIHPVG